jgi:DNA-binding CsgD family transcriptional regulator
MYEPLTLNHYCGSNNYNVIANEYDILRDLILAECDIPGNFFPSEDETEKNCYFLFANETCRFLFIDSGYELFTGYLPKEHEQGGLDFWFSKVHPDDRKMLADRIIESLRIKKHVLNKAEPEPHILNYRFKKGTGEWIWLQHTVYNLSYDRYGKVSKVLHRLRLLDVLIYTAEPTNTISKISLKDTRTLNNLTPREKQVLKLIAEGLSTKLIADTLGISINTVETHRKHLLEKLAAKNSMELIKKAFTLFWN